MADDATVTTKDTTTDTDTDTDTDTATFNVEAVLNADGTFKDGWQDPLVPEEFRNHYVFKGIKDLPGAIKQIGHQALTIARQGKGVFPPTDKSTPTEVEAFWKAVGRPDSPDAYQIAAPQGLEEYFTDDILAETRAAYHAAGLTQKQADLLLARDAKMIADGIKAEKEEAERTKTEAEAALRQKWGTKYDPRLALANRMISENVSPEAQGPLLERISNDPVVADFLANIAEKFVEAKVLDVKPSGTETLNTQIAELMNQPAYVDGNHPLHKVTVDRVQALFVKRNQLSSGGTGRP